MRTAHLGVANPVDPRPSGISARSESSGTLEAIRECVRAALQLAIVEKSRVRVVLRGEPDSTGSKRELVGTPYRIANGLDGRERLTMSVAEGTEQLVLLERVMRVLSSSE